MKAAVLQRTDPARFAALQRNVAMARMQAGAEQAARIAYPIPYRGLAVGAVGTVSAAALRSRELAQAGPQQPDPRIAEVQRQIAVARMQMAQKQRVTEIQKRLLQLQRDRMAKNSQRP
jgi:hypothetical protein